MGFIDFFKRVFGGNENLDFIDFRSEEEQKIEKRAQYDLEGEDEEIAIKIYNLQRNSTSQNKAEIKEIGKFLCANGGNDRMVLVAHRVAYFGGSSRQLEWDWTGICGWQN